MPTPSSRRPERFAGWSCRLALVLALLAGIGAARAHTEASMAIPDAAGWRASLAATYSHYHSSEALSSQALRGYLLRGDAGIDRRGTALEHGVAQLGLRLDETWGAQIALGWHDSDPMHIEAAWLQARSAWQAYRFVAGAGRQRPSLGPVLTAAGHFDAFGLMPLAKRLATDGDWIDDGVEVGARGDAGPVSFIVDAGLWSGRQFPGATPWKVLPHLHAGFEFHGLGGNWSVDAFVARAAPQGRGARMFSVNGAHTHGSPRCDPGLVEVVCFRGRSEIGGLSTRWEAEDWPVTLTAAVMWRNERGDLQSRDGAGQYDARNRGGWIQFLWRPFAAWETGLRDERISSGQSLVGTGANLLASQAALDQYVPLRRTTAMLAYRITPWALVRAEAGREVAQGVSMTFLGLRLMLDWDSNR